MRKKILITEEQLKLIINFIDKDSSLNEQTKGTTNRIGDITINTGTAGISKKDFEKQQEEKYKNISNGSPEELTKLFTEKFISDIGKQTLFKYLPTELKKLMVLSWFNDGGLPEDFFENPDDYKFKITKQTGNINDSFTGTDGLVKIENIENTYEDINRNNFKSYNGNTNQYKYLIVKKGTGEPIFDGNQPKIGDLTLEGYKLFVIAPGIGKGDEAKISNVTSTPSKVTKFVVNIPPIPVKFQVESSNITSESIDIIKKSLFNSFKNNEKIKYAIENKIPYEISDVSIICSASNTWNRKTLPFTHNNDGTKSNIPYDDKIPNARRNLQLANDRGESLSRVLKSDQEIKKELNINDMTNFNVEGIVTNTNGMTDEQLSDTGSNLNIGQFAKFSFTVTYKEIKPGKQSQIVKLNNLVISLVKEKSNRDFKNLFSLNLNKAKYLKSSGERKSARAISKNVGKTFTGFGNFLDSILP
jgi:hypothetical protein